MLHRSLGILPGRVAQKIVPGRLPQPARAEGVQSADLLVFLNFFYFFEQCLVFSSQCFSVVTCLTYLYSPIMSRVQVLSEETAILEVKRLLSREGYHLVSKSNEDVCKKVKKRHKINKSMFWVIVALYMWICSLSTCWAVFIVFLCSFLSYMF